LSNNDALNNFYQLRFAIEFAETGKEEIDSETLTKFRDRYQEILDKLNRTWQKSRVHQQ
jgi:hypothetical protein